MNTLSPSKLQENARKAPLNLLFFPSQALMDSLKRHLPPTERANIVAELFVRYFLSGNSCIKATLDAVLTPDEVDEFTIKMPYDHQDECDDATIDDALWEPQSPFSQACLDAVRKRFRLLFKTEGVIPVFQEGDSPEQRAFLLPFCFTDDKAGVFDCNGEELLNADGAPEWSGYLKCLGIQAHVKVYCDSSIGMPFTGNSLMLPLMMAWWRKQGGDQGLPKYPPFSVVATGGFDEENLLQPVQVKAKAEAVKELLYKAYFIYPQNDEELPKGLDCLPLATSTSLKKAHQMIQQKIERTATWSCAYALQRLETLGKEVRQWNVGQWENMLQRIENAQVFNKREYPDEYLSWLMLQSEAYCHFGGTFKAKEVNQKAMELAEKRGADASSFLIRLKIDRMVDFQDEEDFDSIRLFSERLEEELNKLQDKDLWMRYHGTMAQSHAYGTLAGVDGFSREQAFGHIEKAIDNAIALKNNDDIAQDLNYNFLIHSLFEPSREAEREARNKIRELKDTQDESYEKNRIFFRRIQAFSWYRKLLSSGEVTEFAPFDFNDFIDNNSKINPWLRCTTCKYLAAIFAAKNETEKARQLFKQAISAISDCDGVLKLIKLTAYAEAYRSLGDEWYLSKGRKLLDTMHDDSPSLRAWRKYLENPTKDNFPGLRYWY